MEQDSSSSGTPKRLSQEQTLRQEETAIHKPVGLEFSTPEEAIRYDAARTKPPDRLGERVRASVEREGLTKRSWWRRLFGG